MKKLFLGICLFAMAGIAFAQIHPRGKITDAQTGAPVAGASIEIAGVGSLSTNESGTFELKRIKPGSYRVKITSVGYKPFEGTLDLGAAPIAVSLEEVPLFLQPIEVKALR